MKSLVRTLVVVLFCFFSFMSNAQSWSEYKSWFQYGDGLESLALFAHPTSDYVSGTVVSSDYSSMIVRIVLNDFFLGDYSGKYEIIKGTYNGVEYIKNVSVLSDDALVSPFSAWSRFNDGYAAIWRMLKNEDWPLESLYGESSFYELSGGRKAAFALWALWLQKNS